MFTQSGNVPAKLIRNSVRNMINLCLKVHTFRNQFIWEKICLKLLSPSKTKKELIGDIYYAIAITAKNVIEHSSQVE